MLWEILVPTIMNGRPIHLRYHRVWDAKVRAISGGLTIMGPVKGHWLSQTGELFIERMIPVRLIANADQIEEIADMTAAYYKQQAVMFYRISDTVCIKHYKEDNGRTRKDPTRSGSPGVVLEEKAGTATLPTSGASCR